MSELKPDKEPVIKPTKEKEESITPTTKSKLKLDWLSIGEEIESGLNTAKNKQAYLTQVIRVKIFAKLVKLI